jgi:hypothetical protein
MTDSRNIGQYSRFHSNPAGSGLVDGVDFPHSGLLKALSVGLQNSYAILNGTTADATKNFSIVQTDSSGNTQFLVRAGKVIRDGKLMPEIATATFTQGTPSTFDEPASGNAYFVLVVTSDSTNVLAIRGDKADTDVVPQLTSGDIPIAIIKLNAGGTVNDRSIQYLTTAKSENSVSIGYDAGSTTYTETSAITGTSEGLFISGIGSATVEGTDKVLIQDTNATGVNDVIKTVTASSIAALAPQGDITSVVAGSALTGGGTTGDVTLNVGVDDSTIEINSDALRVKDDGITYAKIQNVVNDERVLGRVSGADGVIEELTQGQVLTFLGDPLQDADFTSNGFMKRNGVGNYTVDGNTYLTAEADTLQTVTGRGASTSIGVVLNGVVNFGSTIIHNKNAAPNNAATINPTITATMNYLNDPSGTATLPAPTAYTDTVITIKNVHPTTMTITPTAGTIDNGLINHDKRVTVTNTIKLLQGESITLQAIADGGIAGVAEGWYIADTDTSGGSSAVAAVEGVSTLALSGSVTVATGQTFVSPRLPVVSLNTSTTLTEATHAGRYIFVTGSGTVITIPDNQGAGVHFTIVNNDGNGFTLRTGSDSSTGDNMNGAQTDIAVAARNGVTCISTGTDYVVLGA